MIQNRVILERYSEEEARQRGIPFKYWKDPTVQAGEYVLTDDGYVVPVRSTRRQVQEYRMIRVDIGQFYVTKRGTLRVPNQQIEKVTRGHIRKVHLRRLAQNFVKAALNLRLAYEMTFGRPPGVTQLAHIVNNQRFWGAVSERLDKDLKDAGLNVPGVLQEMKALLHNDAVDGKTKFSVLSELMDLNNMRKPREVQSPGFMAAFPMVRQNFVPTHSEPVRALPEPVPQNGDATTEE